MRRVDPATRRRQARAAYIARKRHLVALLGGGCAECRESDLRVLQIDHIVGYSEKDGPRSGDALYRALLNGTVPLERVQLLCANCNARKRWTAEELLQYGDDPYE